jgi:hypothetical protein
MLVDLRIQAAMNQQEAYPPYPEESTHRLVGSVGTETAEPWFARVKDRLGRLFR